MKILEFFKKGEKEAEVDVTDFEISEIVDLIRLQKTFGRTGRPYNPEADEINDEDLQAAADYLDRLLK